MGWPWVGLSLVILFVIVVRIRFLDVPLERDEGEFAYVGQLMLEGIAPYKMAYVTKLPGTAAVYALSMSLFGQTPAGIHWGLLLANVAAIVLVFLLAKRWFGAGVGLMAGATYALMSLSWGVYGNAAHATHFVAPAALGAFLLLLRGLESGRLAALFWSGILFGFAFLLKQPGIFFAAFGGLLLLGNDLKARPVDWMLCLKKAAVFCLGIILPFAVLCLILWHAGVFGRFWYWSFTVAAGGWVSMQQGWENFIKFVHRLWLSRQWPFWVQAGLALPFVCRMHAARPLRLLFPSFCAVSILAGSVGWRFNPQYFVLTLPAVGMAIGLGVMEARRLLKNSQSLAFASFLPVTLFCVICGYAVFADRYYFFSATPDEISGAIYRVNPFREAVKVAGYIQKNPAPDSRIAVLGSEPEIYFLAHRHSATGHVSTYILMDGRPYSRDMQQEMIREIKAAAPEYIVFINLSSSWLMHPPAADWTWMDTMTQYEKDHYTQVGVLVDDPSRDQPVFHWDAEATNHPSNRLPCIPVYKIQKKERLAK